MILPALFAAVISLTGPSTVPARVPASFDLLLTGAIDYVALQFSLAGIEWPVSVESAVAGKQSVCTPVGTLINCLVVGGTGAIPVGKVLTFRYTPATDGHKSISLSKVVASRAAALDGAAVQAGPPLEFQVVASCPHTLAGYPVGELLVFRQGVLQQSPGNYTASGEPVVVVPVDAKAGDLWSAVYSRRTSLSREDWACK